MKIAGLLGLIRLALVVAAPRVRRVAKTARVRKRKIKAAPPEVTGRFGPLSAPLRPFLQRAPALVTRRATRPYVAVLILVLARALPSP